MLSDTPQADGAEHTDSPTGNVPSDAASANDLRRAELQQIRGLIDAELGKLEQPAAVGAPPAVPALAAGDRGLVLQPSPEAETSTEEIPRGRSR